MKGECDDTDVASLEKLLDNVQSKRMKKEMMQVKIRRKKRKYMSAMRTRTAMVM